MSTPSLLNIPYLYKAGTLYSQIPESGAGDFTVTRTTTVANRSTRINKDGFIETVLDNVPRLDYPLGGAVNGCPALLVEPSAQNLLQRSEEFENAYWSKSFGNVTQDQTTAPNGLTTADKYVVSNGQPPNSPIIRSFSFAINTTYTLSLFVKRADYDTASIRLNTTETGLISNFFNLASGTATNNQIQNYGNGWYRVWVTFTTAATVTNGQVQLIRDADVRDGVAGIFIWGAQLELGSVPTSYIPTTTAAVTRSADVVSNTVASSLIGQTEGTMYAEFFIDFNNRDADILSLDGGSTSDGFFMSIRNSSVVQLIVRTASANALIFQRAGAYPTGVNKLAVAYKNGDFAICLNGTTVQTNTSSITMPSVSINRAGLGQSRLYPLNQQLRIRAVELHPNRLTNAQLATLTAL